MKNSTTQNSRGVSAWTGPDVDDHFGETIAGARGHSTPDCPTLNGFSEHEDQVSCEEKRTGNPGEEADGTMVGRGATESRTGYPENDRLIRLLRAYREKGDRRAIERLVSMSAGMLNSIARRYANSTGEPHEDLQQVGYVGLMKAINGYSTDSKAKFSSYAYAMIEGELRHHLRDTSLVRRPRWARRLYSKISLATTRLTGELNRPPLIEEIAREINVTPEGVAEVVKLFMDTNVASLDAAGKGSDLEGKPNISVIKSLQYETFSVPVEDRILLEQALESLTEFQRKVIDLFFYKELSQTEIGKRFGLSQRKISRAVASATKRLSEQCA